MEESLWLVGVMGLIQSLLIGFVVFGLWVMARNIALREEEDQTKILEVVLLIACLLLITGSLVLFFLWGRSSALVGVGGVDL